MLKLLAKEFKAGRLKVSPKILYSYAEVLYPDVKAYLESTFRCWVHEVYQGSEGTYAMTCIKDRLHINEDMVLLESYGKDGKPTVPGEQGHRLIVTDLHKRSQPIIRYEINDMITISSTPCSCGSRFRVIERIQGRSEDLFWGIRDGKKHFIYQDYISRKMISVSGEIEDYQAIQESFSKVSLRIKLAKGAEREMIRRQLVEGIRSVFSDYGCRKPEVRVIFRDPLKNKASDKLSRVICRIKDGK